MIPTLLTATYVLIIAFIAARRYWWYSWTSFWISTFGGRKQYSFWSHYPYFLLVPLSLLCSYRVALPIWEAASVDEWLYNGGPYELIVCSTLMTWCSILHGWRESGNWVYVWASLDCCCSAPGAAATAGFLIYPIGQGSFSDGMPDGISGTLNWMIVFHYRLSTASLCTHSTC